MMAQLPSSHIQHMQGTGINGLDHREPEESSSPKRKEVYKYESPYNLYATSWSHHPDSSKRRRLAIASFIEEYNNKINIIQLDEDAGEFIECGGFEHPYPATKVMWIPDQKGTYPDMIATSGDYLRLWRVNPMGGAEIEVLLNNNRTSEYCAPLTSFDWNDIDVSYIGTSSIDTTCTIWQIETGQAIGVVRSTSGTVKTQLIAHDREVFDIAFMHVGNGCEVFATAGADGSVRIFDLRELEHSTIAFEEPSRAPLLRLACNKQDPNYLSTFAYGSSEVVIIDARLPCTPVARLDNHRGRVNGMAWAPHSACHICTAGADNQALIWDIHTMPRPIDDPILAYQALGEVNQVYWSAALPEWIAICYRNVLEILRV